MFNTVKDTIVLDPLNWSCDESQKWVSWTVYHCNLKSVDTSQFRKYGHQLCSMTEKQMLAIAPSCGDILHAKLDVWQAGTVDINLASFWVFYINIQKNLQKAKKL